MRTTAWLIGIGMFATTTLLLAAIFSFATGGALLPNNIVIWGVAAVVAGVFTVPVIRGVGSGRRL